MVILDSHHDRDHVEAERNERFLVTHHPLGWMRRRLD
jgi:hypothetical protein